MIRPLPRIAALVALAACALAGPPARADSIDLTRATCSDFSAMSEDDRNQLSLWLSGYYAGAAQRPALDPDRISAAPAELGALCAKTPQLPLVGTETRAVFQPAPAQ